MGKFELWPVGRTTGVTEPPEEAAQIQAGRREAELGWHLPGAEEGFGEQREARSKGLRMRFKRNKDLKEQIHELQSIIHIQEQGRRLRTQASEEAVRKNRDLIAFLRTTLRAEMQELKLGLKYDHVTISRACLDRKQEKNTLAKHTVEQARESLSQWVFDRMNTHNLLLYEARRRGKRLEELQVMLQDLIGLERVSPEVQLQLQTIRQLENNIEKMQVNIVTADKVHILYVKMVNVLKAELSQLPFLLDDLERRVGTFQLELQGVDLMAVDMLEAMEAAKMDMANAENELIAEKKFRENSLSIQKKQVERVRAKDAVDRHRRMQGRRDLDFSALVLREGTKGPKMEASKAQIEYQGLVISEVEKIKSAVQCSHLWDIAGRFMAQKKSEENLQQQITKSEKKRRGLKSQLKALELQRAELKFHQSPSFLSIKTLEKDLSKNLEEEEERLSRVRDQASKNQELLLHFENGVDNLILRLYDISVPGQEGFPKMEDVFEKLQFCETKLLHLNQKMLHSPFDKFSPDERDESFVHLRNFLEETARNAHQNRRIPFYDDEEDVREAFNFADIDHSYLPSREEIKKESLKLMEEKTKAMKKKQKGAKK
ncbi:coiled-coil domain-containing protein 183 isoform X2 [Thamnophis elegans]|uniref:coiled-coil domain-containing protein 183 isoform X2 n=1 Tax=Thamnophis elegans TaxID=35005 RepID=UPI00137861B5|nr:coiled-coil domain-containing protein 183 isoform X2 [Thamnophis elegans]